MLLVNASRVKQQSEKCVRLIAVLNVRLIIQQSVLSAMVCKKQTSKQTNYSIIANRNTSLHCKMKGNGFLKRQWAMH